MSDIFDLVKIDEASFDLMIMGEKDGKPVESGVTFSLRDLNNVDTQLLVKRDRNIAIGSRILGSDELSEDEEKERAGRMWSMVTSDPTDDQLAACVTGWDWGDHTFAKMDLKFNAKNVIAIFNKAPWIRAQVLAKVIEITGFTKA